MKIAHPEYTAMIKDWTKFRATYRGGKDFVIKYVIPRKGEKTEDYQTRLGLSHCPAHAKSTLNDIKNSIFTRMGQGVSRIGGSIVYQSAIKGENGGVDRKHASMTGFVGSSLLPELLSIGKVGVWVDVPSAGAQPYFNIYRAENIMSWVADENNPGQFTQVLLRSITYVNDEKFGFPSETKETFRVVVKTDDGIIVQDFDEDEEPLAPATLLNLDSIPFVVAELSESLLTDVADYQISLANLDSSDIMYCWASNIPVYTEQTNPDDAYGYSQQNVATRVDPILQSHGVQPTPPAGNSRTLGAFQGIGYTKGLDRPEFISPPSDPLKISMEKQSTMRDDIRTLINLSLTTVKPRAASAESKMVDQRGLEAGLSAIGLELQALENRLAELWAMYEESKAANVNYPDEYELKSDSDRLVYAEHLIKLKENFPSKSAKIAILMEAAQVLLAGKVPTDGLNSILAEIKDSNGCTGDFLAITSDLENGLVSPETASLLRCYDKGEVVKAQKAKAERMAAAMAAQRGSEDFADAKVRGNNANSILSE